jgi:hypothetical protein
MYVEATPLEKLGVLSSIAKYVEEVVVVQEELEELL